jgi:hypothetical protein
MLTTLPCSYPLHDDYAWIHKVQIRIATEEFAEMINEAFKSTANKEDITASAP